MDGDIVDTATTVLLVVGVTALLVPALFPAQQVLYHETGPGTTASGQELRAEGYTVIAYENLSERGQEIYVAALRSPDRTYTVPAGEGAPEFPYDGAAGADEVNSREEYDERRRLTAVVIRRPDDADLPPPDEPVGRLRAESERRAGAEESGRETATPRNTSNRQQQADQRLQVAARYDLLSVRRGPPPVTGSGTLLRLGSVLFGTVAVGVGGYLRSRP